MPLQICLAPYGVVSSGPITAGSDAVPQAIQIAPVLVRGPTELGLERPLHSRAGDPLDAGSTLTPVVAGLDDLVRLCRRARPPDARVRPRGRGDARAPGAATGAGRVREHAARSAGLARHPRRRAHRAAADHRARRRWRAGRRVRVRAGEPARRAARYRRGDRHGAGHGRRPRIPARPAPGIVRPSRRRAASPTAASRRRARC